MWGRLRREMSRRSGWKVELELGDPDFIIFNECSAGEMVVCRQFIRTRALVPLLSDACRVEILCAIPRQCHLLQSWRCTRYDDAN